MVLVVKPAGISNTWKEKARRQDLRAGLGKVKNEAAERQVNSRSIRMAIVNISNPVVSDNSEPRGDPSWIMPQSDVRNYRARLKVAVG